MDKTFTIFSKIGLLWKRLTISKHSQFDDELDIKIGFTEPLFNEPEKITPEKFAQLSDYLISFGLETPLVGISHKALTTAVLHAKATSHVEVGGLCIGTIYQCLNDVRYFVYIHEIINAANLETEGNFQGPAHFTFTPETWRLMIDNYLENFPSARLVGWYHSHPGFGIFLSNMDRFIHDNFFPCTWHVAMVVEPVQEQVGFFVKDINGKLVSKSLAFVKEEEPFHFTHMAIGRGSKHDLTQD